MNKYFQECINGLGDNTKVLSPKESDNLIDKMQATFEFEMNGLNSKSDNVVKSSIDMLRKNMDFNQSCFVLWYEYSLPVVSTQLDKVMCNFVDVTSVSFDTWVVGTNFDWIIEFNHEDVVLFSTLKLNKGLFILDINS